MLIRKIYEIEVGNCLKCAIKLCLRYSSPVAQKLLRWHDAIGEIVAEFIDKSADKTAAVSFPKFVKSSSGNLSSWLTSNGHQRRCSPCGKPLKRPWSLHAPKKALSPSTRNISRSSKVLVHLHLAKTWPLSFPARQSTSLQPRFWPSICLEDKKKSSCKRNTRKTLVDASRRRFYEWVVGPDLRK